VKLLTFQTDEDFAVGVLVGDKVLDLARAADAAGKDIPDDMRGIIEEADTALPDIKAILKASEGKSDLYIPLSEIQFAPPILDMYKNIFCVGRNYKAHIEEMAAAMGRTVEYPKVSEFFTKPPTTIVAHEDEVERHAKYTDKLDYEVELAVIIGTGGRNISKEDALDHVFGYTVVNDVTARDAQRAHGQFFKGKSFDTFCPIGPYIVTKDEFGDPSNHRLTLKVNGTIRQDSNTSDLVHDVPAIIRDLTGALTIEPGDIIATGTPAGVAGGMNPPGWLQVGDVMEAEVEGIGILRNTIVDSEEDE
jgi:2-keto-4-pentenoate hydratase/2-oxohepta-3-ene-1,7-dioic acid hydratase in catechol pathway